MRGLHRRSTTKVSPQPHWRRIRVRKVLAQAPRRLGAHLGRRPTAQERHWGAPHRLAHSCAQAMRGEHRRHETPQAPRPGPPSRGATPGTQGMYPGHRRRAKPGGRQPFKGPTEPRGLQGRMHHRPRTHPRRCKEIRPGGRGGPNQEMCRAILMMLGWHRRPSGTCGRQHRRRTIKRQKALGRTGARQPPAARREDQAHTAGRQVHTARPGTQAMRGWHRRHPEIRKRKRRRCSMQRPKARSCAGKRAATGRPGMQAMHGLHRLRTDVGDSKRPSYRI